METDKLISEARARIIWGELPSSVCNFLTANGIPEVDAKIKINEFYGERNREIRKLNIKNIFIGVILIIVCSVLVYGANNSLIDTSTVRTLGGIATELGIGFGIGCYGLYKLVNGIFYLVRPQLEEKSIS